MNNFFRSLKRLLCLAALFATPLGTQAAEPPPLAAYGQLPGLEDAAISPSGERIAAVATVEGERRLLFLDAEFRVLRTLTVGDLKLRGLDWIGDDAVLLMTSETEKLGPGFTTKQYEAYRALIVPAKPSEPVRVVFSRSDNIVTSIFGDYGIRQVSGEWLGHFGGVALEQDSALNRYLPHARPALFAVRLSDNKARRLAHPARENEWRDWLVDADGKVAATFDMSRTSGEWRIDGPTGKRITSGRHPGGDAGLLSLGSDGTTLIYMAEDADAGIRRWYEIPLDGSSGPSEILADVRVERLYIDQATGRLLGYLRGGEEAGPVFFDPQRQKVADKVHRAFAGRDFSLIDWTPDFGRALVRTSGTGDSGTWYIVDLAQLRAEAFGLERPAIAAEHVGPISSFDYLAEDGLIVLKNPATGFRRQH